jgi:hypothetical protein
MSTVDLGSLIVGLAPVPSPHQARRAQQPNVVSSTFASVSEAASHTPIALKEPAHLPGGARLLDVNVLRGPRDLAIMTYEGTVPGSSLIVVASPLDGGAKQTQLSVGDAIEEARVGTLPAALIELRADKRRNGPGQTTLVWVKGDTVYQAIGVGMPRSELLKVAESI